MPATAAAAQMQVSASTAAMQTHEFIKQLVALGLSEEVAETIASHQTTYVDRSASKGDIDGVKQNIEDLKRDIEDLKTATEQSIENLRQKDIKDLKNAIDQVPDQIKLAKSEVLLKAGFMVVAAVAFLTTVILALLPIMLNAA